MLKPYDYLEAMPESSIIPFPEGKPEFIFYSIDLMEKLDCWDISEFNKAVERAMIACNSLNIPLKENFSRVYIDNRETLYAEWRFTSLACYLVIINCNPANYNVAKAQLFFMKMN